MLTAVNLIYVCTGKLSLLPVWENEIIIDTSAEVVYNQRKIQHEREGVIMRKLAYLKEPYKCNRYGDTVYKIMVCQLKKSGVFLFYYCSQDAVQASFDEYCFDDIEGVLEDWNDEIDERGWIDIDDPLPDCQQDALIPIRVKGRNEGAPQWGKLETLVNGEWVDYEPK